QAADADGSRGGEEQAAQQLDGGGLAGAVGAEEGEQLARLDAQAQGIDRQLVAVLLGDVVEFDHLKVARLRSMRSPLKLASCCRTTASSWGTQVRAVMSCPPRYSMTRHGTGRPSQLSACGSGSTVAVRRVNWLGSLPPIACSANCSSGLAFFSPSPSRT